ncbi:NitT/TauT family transport system ATP-binding protein [Rhizobium paknamense]|uniref:NitT/TauT family transport system ATP-binding protein n=2 Tax=Rhizobium paknamense TaxID=1206817 RepID=A0ABU0IHY5_9HYPH|nr:CmpA/NrtA family ABC transporter substrate-binding protein [Rhizobium paknamense]MDQ0457878.1 NitT/TauT family transport system ATP-binding protein [Rhizobium paknamense]
MTGDKLPPSSLTAPKSVKAETRHLRAGFIPLVDASVLLVAAELGFATAEGLAIDLVKDVSWANVRDRLAFRQFDIAHMLSPMPVAAMLGLGSNPSPTITPFSLGQGGNAITLSVALYRQMADLAETASAPDALVLAEALARLIEKRRDSGQNPLTLGVTYPFSSHNYEFRYWLAAGGINPDRDVKLVVVPPPLTSDALAAGAIDGFCVGAPWNMVASERGVGRIVAIKQDIWPSAPEKVIGLRPEWAADNEETVLRLIVALDKAARWCDDPGHHDDLAALLSDQRFIGAPRDIIRHVLQGQFSLDAEGNRRVIAHYFRFHAENANYPRPSQALWIYSQMIRWGQTRFSAAGQKAAAAAYRPDLYRQALNLPDSMAEQDLRREGEAENDRFIDGYVFDPAEIEAYAAAFPVQADAGETLSEEP